jgi:hypothetical protein
MLDIPNLRFNLYDRVIILFNKRLFTSMIHNLIITENLVVYNAISLLNFDC